MLFIYFKIKLDNKQQYFIQPGGVNCGTDSGV